MSEEQSENPRLPQPSHDTLDTPRLVDAATDTSEFDTADVDLKNQVENLRLELNHTRDCLADSMTTISLLKQNVNMLEGQLEFAPKHGMRVVAEPLLREGGLRSVDIRDTPQDERKRPDTHLVNQPGVSRALVVQGAKISSAGEREITDIEPRRETHHVLPLRSRVSRSVHLDENIDTDRIEERAAQHQERVGLTTRERRMREANVCMDISPVNTTHIRNTRRMSSPGVLDARARSSCLVYGERGEVRWNTIPPREERAFSAGEIRRFFGERRAEHAMLGYDESNMRKDRRRTFSEGMQYPVHQHVGFGGVANSPVSYRPHNTYMQEGSSYARERDMYARDTTSCGGVGSQLTYGRPSLHYTMPYDPIMSREFGVRKAANPPDRLVPGICVNYYFGKPCVGGNTCRYEHVKSPYPEVAFEDDMRPSGFRRPKTEHICVQLFQEGACFHGNMCKYVHRWNIEALRAAYAGLIWDPNSR